eukprot:PhM_4_TR4478/c1_g1_i1/m.40753
MSLWIQSMSKYSSLLLVCMSCIQLRFESTFVSTISCSPLRVMSSSALLTSAKRVSSVSKLGTAATRSTFGDNSAAHRFSLGLNVRCTSRMFCHHRTQSGRVDAVAVAGCGCSPSSGTSVSLMLASRADFTSGDIVKASTASTLEGPSGCPAPGWKFSRSSMASSSMPVMKLRGPAGRSASASPAASTCALCSGASAGGCGGCGGAGGGFVSAGSGRSMTAAPPKASFCLLPDDSSSGCSGSCCCCAVAGSGTYAAGVDDTITCCCCSVFSVVAAASSTSPSGFLFVTGTGLPSRPGSGPYFLTRSVKRLSSLPANCSRMLLTNSRRRGLYLAKNTVRRPQ